MLTFSDEQISEYLMNEYDDDIEESVFMMNFSESISTDDEIIMSDEDILEYLDENEVESDLLEEDLLSI